MQVAMQAIQELQAKKSFEASATGVQPETTPQEASGAVTQAQTLAFRPDLAAKAGK